MIHFYATHRLMDEGNSDLSIFLSFQCFQKKAITLKIRRYFDDDVDNAVGRCMVHFLVFNLNCFDAVQLNFPFVVIESS